MLGMQPYDSPCPIRFCPSGDRDAIEGLFDELIPRAERIEGEDRDRVLRPSGGIDDARHHSGNRSDQ